MILRLPRSTPHYSSAASDVYKSPPYSISNSVYYEYLRWSGGMTNTETFSNKPIEYKANVINANLAEGNAGSTGAYNQNEALGVKNCN